MSNASHSSLRFVYNVLSNIASFPTYFAHDILGCELET